MFDDPKARRVNAEMCKADLYWFARYLFRVRRGFKWQQAEHHKIICQALMRVWRGECKRLIINIPPRYSKTELAVINFMAWALGKNPDCEFIHTSYSADLAALNAWQTRDLVTNPGYREIFPDVALREDSNAKDHWRTTAGSGGSITGFGAGKTRDGFGGAIIVDDPHKADEAKTPEQCKRVTDWFQNTLESRKNDPPRTPIIVIMQRLHEVDLAGWLLEGGNGETWEHVCLPALRDDGSALWPEKHTVEMLRQMEQAAPYTFSGQYQQRPTPAEGGLFRPDIMAVEHSLPPVKRWLRAWDLASCEGKGDWTVGVLLGEMENRRYIIGDVVRLQGRPDQVEAAIISTAARDGRACRISLPQDPGQAGKAQVQYLIRQLAGFPASASPESGDKITRAEPFAAQVNIANVSMLRAEWNAALINEMRNFPFGRYDDQIDALSRAFNEMTASPGPMQISAGALARARSGF
jgi:predicted phage terminase large subunit-like protein